MLFLAYRHSSLLSSKQMKSSFQTNDLCLYYPLTIPSLRHSSLHNIRYGICLFPREPVLSSLDFVSCPSFTVGSVLISAGLSDCSFSILDEELGLTATSILEISWLCNHGGRMRLRAR